MPRLQAADNAQTTLNANINSSVTTFTVTDVSSFPTPPFRITIDLEVMEVGAVTVGTNTFFSILRAQEGTIAASHNSGASVENRFTSGTYNELLSTADKGAPSGVATLGADSKLTTSQVPNNIITTSSVITSSGVTYYVSPTGSDSNNGLSTSSPFQTIGHAFQQVGSKVTVGAASVYLMPGTYNESPQLANCSGSVIIISSYSTNATVNGSFQFVYCNVPILIQNINFNGASSGIFIDVSPMVSIESCTFSNLSGTSDKCIYVDCICRAYITSCTFNNNAGFLIYASYGAVVSVEACGGTGNTNYILVSQGGIFIAAANSYSTSHSPVNSISNNGQIFGA